MNKVDKLIRELCPDGVNFVKFQDVCQYIRGITYNKSQETKTNDALSWKVFRANNITLSSNTLNFDDVKLVKKEVKVKPAQLLKEGDILMCAGSGSKEHVGKVAYIKEDMDYTFGGFMAVIRCNKTLNSRYLFHILTSRAFSRYLSFALNSTTINNLNAFVMGDFTFPAPPLPVQEEIVRILDKFTELEAELEAELEKEQEARRKQYEWYRDRLLSFDSSHPFAQEARSLALEDVLTIKNGRDWKNLPHGDIPVYGSGGIMGFVNESIYSGPTVLIPRKGSLDKLYFVDKPFWNVDTVFYTKINDNIVFPKYVFYCLQKAHLEQLNKAGGVPSLTQSTLNKVRIPVPSIEDQQRITDILDRLDALCNDITTGLPAEIAARRKQYEYYRDKLLSFEEVA